MDNNEGYYTKFIEDNLIDIMAIVYDKTYDEIKEFTHLYVLCTQPHLDSYFFYNNPKVYKFIMMYRKILYDLYDIEIFDKNYVKKYGEIP